MSLDLFVHSNSDQSLLAWNTTAPAHAWVGFQIERRDAKTGTVTLLNNRIPAKPGATDLPASGISSDSSPIRRYLWIDFGADSANQVSYRVTPMVADGAGFTPVDDAASQWSAPTDTTADAGDGLSVNFNRGILMSQVISRLVGGDVSTKSLSALRVKLADPGYPGRDYLSGHARAAVLGFLANADKRGSEVHAAIYELNDAEVIEAFKAFGARAHVLIGNGSSTSPTAASELTSAGVNVYHRDLSRRGASSPSVHNKFIVEVESGGPTRVLTGSTNLTVTGLCTQLNNVLIVERPITAERFLDQWNKLQTAGDDMTPALKSDNAVPTVDGPITTYFAATEGQAEFKEVLDAISQARDGILFLMFMPGDSPLLKAILDRVPVADAIYVRGVVSTVESNAKGDIVKHGTQVIEKGDDPAAFQDDVLLPNGLPDDNVPAWAKPEFQRGSYLSAHLNAIVHSKAIVIDPFSDDCVVVTGSHNFSPAASKSNDENLVIIRGNKALAQAYAVHMEGVYDHYAWRAFLSDGGNSGEIYQSMDSWLNNPKQKRELEFWAR